SDVGAGLISAQFSNTVTMSVNASFTANAIQLDAGKILNLNGGTLTFKLLTMFPDNVNPGKIQIGGDVTIAGWGGGTAGLISSGNFGTINLMGGTRTITVPDGAADIDALLAAPITNGGLIKSGAGTL